MINDKIGDVLKKYRKRCGMSVRDVALTLNRDYQLKVAEKTIYGWESDQAHPTTIMFLTLCEIYQINSFKDITNTTPRGFAITSEERALIESYRKQPDLQHAVKRMLGMSAPPTRPGAPLPPHKKTDSYSISQKSDRKPL